MYEETTGRRTAWMLRGGMILASVIFLLSVIPSPFLIEIPGPTVDMLGEVETDGETAPLIRVTGSETYQTSGELRLLTVGVQGDPQHPVSFLKLIPALFDNTQALIPVSELYPEGVTAKDREQYNESLMRSSQYEAVAAAATALGERVTATLSVASVAEDGPAAGVLAVGDQLRAVNGEAVDHFTQLKTMISRHGAEQAMRLGIIRSGRHREVTITPVVPPGGSEPVIGVAVASEYDLPFTVDFSIEDIGGPSAGLVFALAVYDMLTPESLLAGMNMSGTGTVDEAGNVGEIGGLPQKMWAASRAGSELFVMPMSNCDDVPDARPDHLMIAPVNTLQEATAAIEVVRDGGVPAGLERCGR